MLTRPLSRALPLLVLAAAACVDGPTFASRESGRTPVLSSTDATPSGKVVVVFKDSTAIPQAGLDLITSLGGTVSTRQDAIGVAYVAGLSNSALTDLMASNLVLTVGPDYELNWLPGLRVGSTLEVEGGVQPSSDKDPTKAARYASAQWNMRVIQADKAWAQGHFGSPAVRVAILDTGIDYDNRELRGHVDLSRSKSFITTPEPILVSDHEVMDAHFHGTHVASTVVTNAITIAGVSSHVTLFGVKVLSFRGSGTFEGVTSGILHAAEQDADVINMSLGAEVDRQAEGVGALVTALKRAINRAEQLGTLVISAAGNSGLNLDDPASPMAVPCEVSSMCISATGPVLQQNFDQAAFYTNYGKSAITVAAPGGNADPVNGNDVNEDLILGACSRRAQSPPLQVCAANNKEGAPYFYVFAAGTSMAAPHASGVAAMVKSVHPGLNVSQLKHRITQYADDIGEAGRDAFFGWGRVNVYRSINGS